MISLKDAREQRVLKKNPINMRITGWISHYLIYIGAKLRISPNLISFSWIIIAFLGIFFIALGGYWNALIGILIYHFALILDSIDGGIARLTNKTNAGGEFLDRFFSTLNRSLILFAMGYGLFRIGKGEIFLYLGIYSAILLYLENSIKMKNYESLINSNRVDLIKKRSSKINKLNLNIAFYLKELFRPGNHFTLAFFSILFGLIDWYLYVFSALISIQIIFVFFKVFFELKNTPQSLSKKKF